MNHYPHHLGDYAKDTLGLSALEHGVYRLLLDAYYASEEALAADEVHAIAKAGTSVERKAVDKVLRKFELRDGRYYHKRVELELEAYRERSKVAAEKAKKRWRKGKEPDAQPMPQHSPGTAEAMLASSHKPEENLNQETAPSVSSTVAPEAPCAALALQAPEDRIHALRGLCIANRVRVEGRDQAHIRQFAAEGVTDEQLRDAIAIARDRKPNPEVIPFAYLVPIIVAVRLGKRAGASLTKDEIYAKAMANIAAKEANAPH